MSGTKITASVNCESSFHAPAFSSSSLSLNTPLGPPFFLLPLQFFFFFLPTPAPKKLRYRPPWNLPATRSSSLPRCILDGRPQPRAISRAQVPVAVASRVSPLLPSSDLGRVTMAAISASLDHGFRENEGPGGVFKEEKEEVRKAGA